MTVMTKDLLGALSRNDREEIETFAEAMGAVAAMRLPAGTEHERAERLVVVDEMRGVLLARRVANAARRAMARGAA